VVRIGANERRSGAGGTFTSSAESRREAKQIVRRSRVYSTPRCVRLTTKGVVCWQGCEVEGEDDGCRSPKRATGHQQGTRGSATENISPTFPSSRDPGPNKMNRDPHVASRYRGSTKLQSIPDWCRVVEIEGVHDMYSDPEFSFCSARLDRSPDDDPRS